MTWRPQCDWCGTLLWGKGESANFVRVKVYDEKNREVCVLDACESCHDRIFIDERISTNALESQETGSG